MQIFPVPLFVGPMPAFQPETTVSVDRAECFDMFVNAPENGVLDSANVSDVAKIFSAIPEEKGDAAGNSNSETTDDDALSPVTTFPLCPAPLSFEPAAAWGESQQPPNMDATLYTTDITSNSYENGPPSHLNWPIEVSPNQQSDTLALDEDTSRMEPQAADTPTPPHFPQGPNATQQDAEAPSELGRSRALVGPHTTAPRVPPAEAKDGHKTAPPSKDTAIESQTALGVNSQRAPSAGLSAPADHPVKTMGTEGQPSNDTAEPPSSKTPATPANPISPDFAQAVSARPPPAPLEPAAHSNNPTSGQSPDPADFPLSSIEGQTLPLPRHPAFPVLPTPGSATPHPVAVQAAAAVFHSVSAGETATELTLSPEDLGKIRFEIISSDDKLTVRMFVERPDTLDLVRRQGDQLLAELRQAGFTQASLSFGNWQQQGRKQADQVALALPGTAEDRPQGQTLAPHYIPPLAPFGRLNIRL